MLKRTFTAIVGITAAFFLIRSGGLIFALAVLCLALVGWYEFRVMMLSKGYKVYYLTSCSAVALLNILPSFEQEKLIVPILTAAILAIMLEGLYYHKRGNWAPEVALSSFAVLYIGLLFSHFTMRREISSSTSYTTSFVATNCVLLLCPQAAKIRTLRCGSSPHKIIILRGPLWDKVSRSATDLRAPD